MESGSWTIECRQSVERNGPQDHVLLCRDASARKLRTFQSVHLKSLQIEGFKRFGDEAVLRLRGQSMAILGANESGKTSVLEAIEHLGRQGFPAATQFTDRQARPASRGFFRRASQLSQLM
jgi:AAA domain